MNSRVWGSSSVMHPAWCFGWVGAVEGWAPPSAFMQRALRETQRDTTERPRYRESVVCLFRLCAVVWLLYSPVFYHHKKLFFLLKWCFMMWLFSVMYKEAENQNTICWMLENTQTQLKRLCCYSSSGHNSCLKLAVFFLHMFTSKPNCLVFCTILCTAPQKRSCSVIFWFVVCITLNNKNVVQLKESFWTVISWSFHRAWSDTTKADWPVDLGVVCGC